MDSSGSNLCDIFEIYRRYCDVRSGNAYHSREDGYRQDDESHRAKYSRDALGQLLKSVEARSHTRFSIFDELFKLMSELELIADFSAFSRFYDFVFFMCRENGQKNITVSRAIAAWRLVLSGRFRLLNQWCDFVEKNQRHNISEDTWQQVLAFSRCVYENLEGYDPEGAWPVLIDDFVEHMYRVSGPAENPTFFCSCGDLESQSCLYEDSLPGLKIVPGLKRKLPDLQVNGMESSETLNWSSISKRSRMVGQGPVYSGDDMPTNSAEDCMDVIKHSSPRCSSRSPCAVEGCLSKGFAGLFSSRSYLQFGRERRVSST